MDSSTPVGIADLIDRHIAASDDLVRAREIVEERRMEFEELDDRLSKALLNRFHGKILVRNGKGYFYDDQVDGFTEFPVIVVDETETQDKSGRVLSSINPEIGMDVLVTLDEIAEGRVTL